VWLAWDCWAFRGENAVANGWLQRARRLLEGQPASAERAWLEVREGSLCLLVEGDPERAHAMAAEGIRLAKEAGNLDLEMLGRAVQGLALVASGAVAEGMRGLDEVNTAIVAGELTDLVAIGLSCCYLISACERVRDYDRATQWCTRLKAFCAKWGLRPLFAVCRTQYASICMWRGTWNRRAGLQAASDELAASRPAMTGDALGGSASAAPPGRLVEAAALRSGRLARPAATQARRARAFDRGDPRAVEHASASRHADAATVRSRRRPRHGRPGICARDWDAPKPPLPSLEYRGDCNDAAQRGGQFRVGRVALGRSGDRARQHPRRRRRSLSAGGRAVRAGRARTGWRALSRSDAADAADEMNRAIAVFSSARGLKSAARAPGVHRRTERAAEQKQSVRWSE
jgi:hypothetical protein